MKHSLLRHFGGAFSVLTLTIAILPLGRLWSQEVEYPRITREQALEVVEKSKSKWLASVTPGQERLFYNKDEWGKVIDRLLKAKGRGAELRKALFDSADRICASGIPEYRSPDQMPPGTVNANEEGWIRSFGGDVFCLAIAAKVKPEERYRKALRERVLAGCKFETWGRHKETVVKEFRGKILTNMDLSAGAMACGVAAAYDLNRDIFSNEEKAFIREVMAQRMHNILEGLYGKIFWSNWYTQNHNHVSVGGLAVAAIAFLDEIPEAPEWLAGSYLNFKNVEKTLDADGSSYEGVPYWGYGRSYIIQYIEATKIALGSDEMYQNPAFKNAIPFRLASSVPGFNGTLLWSDSRGHENNLHIMARLASQYRDKEGQYFVEHSTFMPNGSSNVALAALMYDPTVEAQMPTELDYHAEVWDMATSRSGWGDGDYMMAVKSGYNVNHHTQLDAGSITVNASGGWLLSNSGYGLGLGKPGYFDKVAKTGKRWNFLSASTQSHSTLLINGENQRSDKDARAVTEHFVSNWDSLWMDINMNDVFENVKDASRRIFHRRGDYILVLDKIESPTPVNVEWLAQVPPNAESKGKDLFVSAGLESLLIKNLADTSSFKERKPVSEILDVPATRIKTMASSASGASTKFAMLLQPNLSNVPVKELKSSWENGKDGEHVEVSDGNWKDDLWLQKECSAISLPGGSQAVAEMASIRTVKGKITSLMLSAALKLSSPLLSFSARKPSDISILEGKEGSMILSFGRDFDGEISFPDKAKLFNEEGRAISPGKIAKGRYIVAHNASDAKQVAQWGEKLFSPHPKAQYPVAQAPVLAPISSSNRIKWEAEASPAQQYGIAEVVDQSSASGGKSLASFGAEIPFHSISWKVNIAEGGAYKLKIRYAADQPVVRFNVLIDGKVFGNSFENAILSGPKGWGNERYWKVNNLNWIEQFIEDGKGELLLLPLTAGGHEITLARPTSGLILDSLELIGAK